jgi:hypothetical protein
LVALFTPAVAAQFYLVFDPASHKCLVFHALPPATMKVLGTYVSEDEATNAMPIMKECKQVAPF